MYAVSGGLVGTVRVILLLLCGDTKYNLFISVINQLDVQNFCFTISFISCLYMFRAHALIIRRSKLHYTASGIITPIGVMIPEASTGSFFFLMLLLNHNIVTFVSRVIAYDSVTLPKYIHMSKTKL